MDTSPNSSLSKVRKWLAKRPENARKLVLFGSAAGGGTSVKLGDWTAEDTVPPVVAEDIMAAVDGYVETIEQTVLAVLQWVDADKQEIHSMPLRRRKAQVVQPDMQDTGTALEGLTGDANALVVQAQKHLEAMTRIYVGALGGQMQTMMRTNEHVLELLERMSSHAAESDHKVKKLTLERDELASVLAEQDAARSDEDATTGTQAAQNNVLKLLEPVIQNMLIKALASGADSSGAPPAA